MAAPASPPQRPALALLPAAAAVCPPPLSVRVERCYDVSRRRLRPLDFQNHFIQYAAGIICVLCVWCVRGCVMRGCVMYLCVGAGGWLQFSSCQLAAALRLK